MKFYFLIIVFSLIAACSKQSNNVNDVQSPVITITTPSNNQVFNGSQSVNITGAVTDENKITELHVHIFNTSTGVLLIDIHRTPASSAYNLNENFVVQPGTNYKIQLLAKDAAANEAITTVNISTI